MFLKNFNLFNVIGVHFVLTIFSHTFIALWVATRLWLCFVLPVRYTVNIMHMTYILFFATMLWIM